MFYNCKTYITSIEVHLNKSTALSTKLTAVCFEISDISHRVVNHFIVHNYFIYMTAPFVHL